MAKKKILWIDDNPRDLEEEVKAIGRICQIIIVLASTLNIGLFKLMRNDFSMIVTDNMLPDKSINIGESVYQCTHQSGMLLVSLIKDGTIEQNLSKKRITDLPIVVCSMNRCSVIEKYIKKYENVYCIEKPAYGDEDSFVNSFVTLVKSKV